MTPDEVEDFRRVAEARHWLSLGYNSPQRIAELRLRITAKRGATAADRLIQEMRHQYKRGGANG